MSTWQSAPTYDGLWRVLGRRGEIDVVKFTRAEDKDGVPQWCSEWFFGEGDYAPADELPDDWRFAPALTRSS